MQGQRGSANDKVKITVLGSGSWGSTLAWLLCSAGRTVTLWSRDAQKASLLNSRRKVNHPHKVALPDRLEITADLPQALAGAGLVLFCCNSQSMRELASKAAVFAERRQAKEGAWKFPILISAAKGLELQSLYRMSQVLAELTPDLPVCALSGPNLAGEIAKGLPAATVVACSQAEVAAFARDLLGTPSFRVYSNNDLVGVELGGTLKNVIAIAAGASDGLGLGANAKAALLTRGLAEMTRLACALGAQQSTLYGLSGLGDLLATCGSELSRNYSIGLSMARGLSREEARRAVGTTAEGIPTSEAVCELSKKLAIPMPIAEQVEATLKGNSTPAGAIMSLMTRPLVSE